MKTLYERTGSKGSWQSITDWWYCPSCNTMKQLPSYPISSNPDDYLNEDAKNKYPQISKIRNKFNVNYVDMHELREKIEDKRDTDVNKAHPSIAGVATLEKSAWICSVCKDFEIIPKGQLSLDMSEQSLEDIAPTHCDAIMKLGMITYKQIENKYDKIKSKIIQLIDDEKLDKAGNLFLEYSLELFILLLFKRMISDFIYLTKQYEQIQNTKEYHIVHYFISLFSKQNWIYEFNLIPINALSTVHLRISNSSQANIIYNHFLDLKHLIIETKKIKANYKLYKYYSLLWTIEQMILDLGNKGQLPDKTSIANK